MSDVIDRLIRYCSVSTQSDPANEAEVPSNPDEFDLGYYSYGLRTYGNLPLIEPLESRESKKIRDFVIVIDTSESTSGELVKAFLKETFGLLKTGESFFAKCNIAVMQCDDAVRDLTFLHSTDELDRFAARLTLTGGTVEMIDNPSSYPDPSNIVKQEEPFVDVHLYTPNDYVGALMDLCQQKRGVLIDMKYLDDVRVDLHYALQIGRAHV